MLIARIDGNYDILHLDKNIQSSVIFDNLMILTHSRRDSGGYVTAHDLKSNELIWKFSPPNVGNPYEMRLISDNNRVYVGFTSNQSSNAHGIFALNPHSGSVIWQFRGIPPRSAVLADGYLYVDDGLGLLKLNPINGNRIWYSDYESAYGGLPIFYGYGHIYATHNGEIKILNAETGEIVHRFSPPDGSYFWLVTAAHGRIFAQSNRHLYAYAPWGHTEPIP